jgi:hypothetical protein
MIGRMGNPNDLQQAFDMDFSSADLHAMSKTFSLLQSSLLSKMANFLPKKINLQEEFKDGRRNV